VDDSGGDMSNQTIKLQEIILESDVVLMDTSIDASVNGEGSWVTRLFGNKRRYASLDVVLLGKKIRDFEWYLSCVNEDNVYVVEGVVQEFKRIERILKNKISDFENQEEYDKGKRIGVHLRDRRKSEERRSALSGLHSVLSEFINEGEDSVFRPSNQETYESFYKAILKLVELTKSKTDYSSKYVRRRTHGDTHADESNFTRRINCLTLNLIWFNNSCI